MRICTLLFFFISALTCHSLYAHTPESSYFLMQDSTSSLTSLNLPAKPKKTKELFQQNFSYMGIPFIVSGLIVKKQNQDFRTLRNRFQPTFHHEYDNYTQYVPLVATWGMKLAGVESRSSWKELTVSNIFSAALMAGFVNTLKYTTKEMRPDNSSNNSFPWLLCVPQSCIKNTACSARGTASEDIP